MPPLKGLDSTCRAPGTHMPGFPFPPLRGSVLFSAVKALPDTNPVFFSGLKSRAPFIWHPFEASGEMVVGDFGSGRLDAREGLDEGIRRTVAVMHNDIPAGARAGP